MNLEQLNWDKVLSGVNNWYDRLATIMLVKDRGKRIKQLDQLETDLKKLKKDFSDLETVAKLLTAEKTPGMEREKIVCDLLVYTLFPFISKVQYAADRVEQYNRNLRLGFALVAYHRDHSKYPKKLKALIPDYVLEIPKDLFSGKAILYQPTKNSFLLYSVGQNGKDEKGQTFGDDPRGDDLPVRLPLPALKKK